MQKENTERKEKEVALEIIGHMQFDLEFPLTSLVKENNEGFVPQRACHMNF
jgi:hypothetical protein